jgi:hypothetical protein
MQELRVLDEHGGGDAAGGRGVEAAVLHKVHYAMVAQWPMMYTSRVAAAATNNRCLGWSRGGHKTRYLSPEPEKPEPKIPKN